MKSTKILISLIVFIFAIFSFPSLNEAAQNVNTTSPLAPIVQNFPLIFIAITVIFPIYFIVREENE